MRLFAYFNLPSPNVTNKLAAQVDMTNILGIIHSRRNPSMNYCLTLSCLQSHAVMDALSMPRSSKQTNKLSSDPGIHTNMTHLDETTSDTPKTAICLLFVVLFFVLF